MKLGLSTARMNVNFGLWGSGVEPNIKVVQLAERLGYDSIWTAEANGTDAVSTLAWMAAHTSTIKIGTAVMQMTARPPTTTAMTAATLDLLSGGRFILGLGASGPAVVEGWHGVAYGRPIARTREYLGVVRDVLGRHHIDHDGAYYQLPYRGPDGTGHNGPAKLNFRPPRRALPIYLGAMGPRNLALAYELADGVMPAFYSPFREDVFFSFCDDRPPRSIELAPFVSVAVGADQQACRDRLKPSIAYYLGGMGSKRRNFYNEYISRLGFEDATRTVLELYSSGRRREAASAVPDDLLDEIALCGPKEAIAEQLEAWEASSVSTMILIGADVDSMTTVAELVL